MDSVFETIMDAFTGMLKDATGASVEWLKLSDTWDIVAGSSGRLAGVYNYLIMIGIGMAIVYFLIEMNQKLALEGRDLNMKSMFAPFLKFVCAVVAIRYSGEIVSYILSMNDNFVQHIADISSTTGELTPENIDNTGGFFLMLFVVFVCIIGLILSIILKLVWMYKAMLYQMEVYFRIALLPVAVADVYSGMHSNGIKYIKGFLALGIYAVSMIVVPNILIDISSSWAFSATGDDGNIFIALSGILTLLVAPFAALGATSVTKQLAKEALGA